MSQPFPVDVQNDYLDVLTAFGTVSATLLAVLAIWMQIRDRRQLAEDARRLQASRLSAWVEDLEADKGDAARYVTRKRAVKVRNGSDEPIYDLALKWPGATARSVMWIGAVPPQATGMYPADAAVGDPGVITFEMEFRDASGIQWKRSPDGRLVVKAEVDRPPSGAGRHPPEYRLY